MSRRNPNDTVQITSAAQCLQEFDLLKQALLVEETEDSWQNIDSNLKRFIAAIRGGACDYPDEFLKRWKETEIVRGIVSAMSTERTRLSGTALDLVSATSRLGHYWDSAVPFYAPTIIKLLGRASKIYVARATATLTQLIKGTKSLGFIPYLIDGISDKSLTTRIGCADALLCCLSGATIDADPTRTNRPKASSRDALTKRLNDIENVIKIGGRDRDPKVRAIIKRIWELYEQQWPARAANLVQPFTPTIKRYLGISCHSALGSSTQTVSVPPARLHTSHQPNQDTNNTHQKGSPSAHQRTRSKNAAEGNSHAPAKVASHNSSKPVKSQNSHVSFPKSNDLATLQKAMMIPLPRDEPERHEPPVAGGSARARVLSVRTRTPPEGSIHQVHLSGPIMKRSNSTMRAQRVPLSSHPDLPAGGVNGNTRGPIRVPLQSIQSSGHSGKGVPPKPLMNLSVSSHPESSTKPLGANTASNSSKTSFKPTRVVSNTTQADSKPASQPHPLQTRPLPRRAAPEAPSEKVIVAPPPNNALSVSVRSNTHSRKAPAEQELPVRSNTQSRKAPVEPELPILKPTRKAFKPTKPSSLVSSAGSSKPATAKTVVDSKPVPTPSCVPNTVPLQAMKPPIPIQDLPEGLRLPASIPLPCSPSPPPTSLLPSTLPSQSAPSSAHVPVSDAPSENILPTESLPPPPPPPPALLSSSAPTPRHQVGDVDQDPSVTITHHSPSVKLQPGKPTEVIPQPLKSHIKPLSSSMPSFGTPGPKICRRLPDDLIVPMSIPLPPSPNSPFPQLNLRSRFTPRIDRRNPRTKSGRTQQTPRSRAMSSKAGLATPNVPGEANGEQQHRPPPSPHTLSSQLDGDEEAGDHTTPHHVVQEGILVDFDHEDTIWIPRPLAIHDDLLQLNNVLGVATVVQEESDDGEDGPHEKRRRLGMEETSPEQAPRPRNKAGSEEAEPAPPELPKLSAHQRPLRRDPSMFHWDLPDLDTHDPDDSGEKTISCLKEQPPFLAGDVTINEGISFNAHFAGHINARDQSTPASDNTPQPAHKFPISNLSP